MKWRDLPLRKVASLFPLMLKKEKMIVVEIQRNVDGGEKQS